MDHQLKLITKELAYIAHKFYGVKVSFPKTRTAFADIKQEKVIVGLLPSTRMTYDENIGWIVSAFFHEVGHIVAARNNKFKLYHRHQTVVTRAHARAIRRTAWRAEVYVDKIGEKLQKEFYPTLPYRKGYSTLKHKQWLRNYWSKI